MRFPNVADPDLAATARVFADPRRIRVLMALADGRALPAGRLAQEAGVSASTVSNHLAVLLGEDLVAVEKSGRHRFYRLATPHVEGILEALARVAPSRPVTSLRAHTRSAQLRAGRTCYRHLAGRLGVELFQAMLAGGWIAGGDGTFNATRGDRLSSVGTGTQYRLTPHGSTALTRWGVPSSWLSTRVPLKYCIDWTEQAHHLAGPLGTAVCDAFRRQRWIRDGATPRSVVLTPSGRTAVDQIDADQG